MLKLLLQNIHKLLPHLMLQIILLIFIPLDDTRIPPNWANINHAIPKFHKGPSLNRDI